MPSLVEIATKYIEDQFEAIVDLVRFEPADQLTADGIEAMMTSMLHRLVQNKMIYDYQVKSSAVAGHKIYTSVIFQLTSYSSYVHINFESHLKIHNKKNANAKDTAFDRAMKGI